MKYALIKKTNLILSPSALDMSRGMVRKIDGIFNCVPTSSFCSFTAPGFFRSKTFKKDYKKPKISDKQTETFSFQTLKPVFYSLHRQAKMMENYHYGRLEKCLTFSS